jgi:hypothetical protein
MVKEMWESGADVIVRDSFLLHSYAIDLKILIGDY